VFIGVILTGSRGASVALFASIMYIVVKSKKIIVALAVLVIAIFVVMAVAPPTYFERIHSITNAGEDSSTRGRLMAWKAATQMAIDYPLGIGAGNFPSVYGRYYRDTYADQTIYAPNRWISVHSIYFLTLAEYGMGGLLLLIYFIYKMFKQNSESETMMIAKEKTKNTQRWLPIALKASIIALAVDGIFLGGLNYPHIYLLAAMTLATRELTENMQAVECK
jgi:O-antigen ligase